MDIGLEAVGLVAIILGSVGFVWANPRIVMRSLAAASATWTVYYALSDAWSGVAATAMGFLRWCVGAFAPDWAMRPVAICLGLAGAVLAWWFGAGVAAIAAAIGVLLRTAAMMLRDRPVTFRVAAIGGEGCWLVHDILMATWAAAASSVLSAAIILGSGVRLWWRARPADYTAAS